MSGAQVDARVVAANKAKLENAMLEEELDDALMPAEDEEEIWSGVGDAIRAGMGTSPFEVGSELSVEEELSDEELDDMVI